MDVNFRPTPKPKHKRRVKKRGDRSKFSKMVRDKVKEHFNNQCAQCGKLAFHVHHVTPRSSSGRNVFTNGMLLCANCHRLVHADNDLLKYWKNVFKEKYGPLYFMDKEDLEHKYLTQELREQDQEVRLWVKFNNKQGCSDENMFC